MKKYVVSLKWATVLVVSLFLTAAVVGFFFAGELSFLWGELEKLSRDLARYSVVGRFALIFVGNFALSALAVLLGVVFALFPVLISVGIGLEAGVGGVHAAKTGASIFWMGGIPPHMVVEVPSILLSSAIGVKVGYEVFLWTGRRGGDVTGELGEGLKFFGLCVTPLLLLASFIETFVTPLLLG